MKKLSLVLLIGYCLACGGAEEDITLRLTPNERTQIDTIYTRRVKALRPVLDSLCTARHDELVRLALDSIVAERLRKEALLRANIPVAGADTARTNPLPQ